ncbi:MAG: KDO2-lipid IV(A) lauroyltransferase [Alphaproteobacteria bacterium]|jgi:KDO2-lipid IV(A) lauroyltransferase
MLNPKHIIEYSIGRLFLGGLGLLPLPVASFIGAKIGAFVATLPINAHTTARRNIARAFPEKSIEEVRAIQYAATQNLMQTILEMPALYKLSAKNFNKYIDVQGLEHMKNTPSNLLLTAHFGNWETLLKTMGHHKIPVAAIYRRANNPYMDKYITNLRHQSTGVMIAKGRAGGRNLIKAVRDNMSAAFLNDQKMSDGIECTFFGQKVTAASGIADLALKYNRGVCPVFCTRRGYGKFTVIFSAPLDIVRTGDNKQDAITNIQNFNDIIEEQIRQKPELWLWHHKRFPKKLNPI